MTLQAMLNMSVLPPPMLIGPSLLRQLATASGYSLSERGTENIPGDGEYAMLSERTLINVT